MKVRQAGGGGASRARVLDAASTSSAAAAPPHHPGRRHRLLRAVAAAAALGLPVAVLALLVRAQVDAVLGLDESAIQAATEITRARPGLLASLIAWEVAFQGVWVNTVVGLICWWAWRRHGLKTRALWAFVTVMTAWGLQALTKLVVQRTRPVVEDAIAHSGGYSFPSGHAANTAAAMLALTILVWPLLDRRGRVAVPSIAAVLVALTALDRVFLGVHYPSDVVAGVLFGVAVTTASFVAYRGSTPSVRVHERDATSARVDADPGT
jgi:membrane-associated phospholipid phosphatase